MKTLRLKIVTLFFLMVGWTTMYGQQNRLEVPGDQFSLEGALELFKKSASPEEFEKLLNSSNAGVNNLDLNGDGDIDYIRVIDRNEGNVHTFTMQAVISSNESQDIAVIALEKLGNGKALLQIIGDADIYGIETIIEPTTEVRVNAGTSAVQTVVNVWTWPSVQYVYSPYYYGWVSPWTWAYRPMWWNPWRPVGYVSYYSRWDSYRPYYSVCYTNRIHYATQIYRPYRSTSVVVYNRHREQIANYRSNHVGDTRGRDNNGRSGNNAYNRGNDHSRSNSNDRNGSRSYDNGRQRNESNRSAQDRNQSSENRRSTTITQDNSTFKNRPAINDNRSSDWQSKQREVKRDDSRNRSNQVNTNPVMPKREVRTLDTRSTQRTVPQLERRSAPTPQRSAPQIDRKPSSGNSGGQRSGSSGSGGGSKPVHKRGDN